MSRPTAGFLAEPAIRGALAAIDSATDTAAVHSAERADALLARIAWSRLTEPGDRVAHEVLTCIGPEHALLMLMRGTTGTDLLRACERHAAEAEEPHTLSPDLTVRACTAALKRWVPRLDRRGAHEDLDRAQQGGLRVVLPEDSLWPRTLVDLGAHAPLMLWVRGDPAHLSSTALSVVGSRAASGYGSDVTAEFTAAAAQAGATIVSGAAYGIDAVAHRTALHLERPTVALLAGGADRAYPRAHETLLQRIGEHGAVCAEMPPGAAPTRWRFLMRNRLIASLSAATLVTEAGPRSGSLNTAGHAAEIGRPLGAVPGPVTSAASRGCHRLIREYGATLISGTSDVIELLGGDVGSPTDPSPADGDGTRQPATHRRLLDALPLRGTRTLRDAAARAGLDPDDARDAAAELELLGFMTRDETPYGGEERWRLHRRE
ncbi:DNA-processing protein DprA [Leucobacter tardus]|uniref:DNA-processing protein DprA n=1 Tax=Leucobacter tardus TaxID=501483 RepID=A0A939QCH4_9MICO|nr:DNA-processing protein DprA [Leucobacter tardus]MBO2989645.1 DNA-processing protein DprA [Leucobacter tardus]